MSSHSSFQGKIDVLDLLINILKSHEESLSDIVDKLDTFLDNLSLAQKKISKLDQILKRENLSHILEKLDLFVDNLSSVIEKISTESASENGWRVSVMDCKEWLEFRKASVSASLVAFETDIWNVFSVTSRSREFIFRYSEKLPVSRNDIMPEDSICRKVSDLDTRSLRHWLSQELEVPKDRIIQGNLSKSLGSLNQYLAT